MQKKANIIQERYIKAYVVFTLLSLAVYVIIVFVSHGEAINNIFFMNVHDTGMDFFNCVATAGGFRDYKTSPSGQYPPLACLFYWIILWSTPLKEATYYQICDSDGRIIAGNLRLFQGTMLAFLFITLVTVLIIVGVAGSLYTDMRCGVVLAGLSVSSWGCLYAIERGNIILQAYMFLLIFVVYYRSENKLVRELAFISLALATGLKLYPLAFIMLLVSEQRWKEAVRTLLYCMISVFGLFVIRGGLEGLVYYIKIVFYWGGHVFGNIFGSVPQILLIVIVLSVVVGGCLYLWVLFRERHIWKKVYIIGCVAIVGGGILFYDYAYVMMIPAMLLFLCEKDHERIDLIYFLLLCILNLPIPIINKEGVAINTFHSFIMCGAMFIMLIMFGVQSVCDQYKNIVH